MNKILVTGDRGFIGSHLTSRLNKLGIDWVGFDLRDGKDTRNRYSVYEAFDFHCPDTVIHLAALAGVRRGEEFPEEYFSTNVMGTLNLLKTAEQFGVKKFINFSSSSVFGDIRPPVNEDTAKNPKSIYGLTKLTAERLCEVSPLATIIIRPFTVYGINGRPDMVVYKWLDCIRRGEPVDFYGNGKSKRGYVHVDDLVDGVICLLDSRVNSSTSYNLGGQEIISLEKLCRIFQKQFKELKIKRLPMPSADIHENWADVSKAQRELGWTPKRIFEKELKNIFKSYLSTKSAPRG